MSVFLIAPTTTTLLDYTENWDDGWLAEGETITASSWTLPSGITKSTDEHDSTTATVWLTGATHGEEYVVTNAITTSLGCKDTRSIKLICRNR